MKNPCSRTILATFFAATLLAATAHAASFTFEGNIDYHNDIVYTYFTVNADATDVRIWTDSFQDGINFDPITALWTSAGLLLAQNDDNPYIEQDQTYWDSGIVLPTISAGDYIFTIASYWNFANGTTLSQGFAFDGQTPIPITQHWNGGTGYWRLHLEGVDAATSGGSVVPEPGTLLLLGSGLLGLAGCGRRRKK
jgi:hypothetical protein